MTIIPLLGSPNLLASWLKSERIQVVMAFVVACVIPFAVRYSIFSVGFWDQANTSIYVCLGIILSHLLVRVLSIYPGENPFSQVIPSVVLGFGISILLIIAGQLTYSRSLLAAGFLGTLTSYSLVSFFKSRYLRERLALAPVQNADELLEHKTIDWIPVSTPTSVDALGKVDGIVLDLASESSKNWSELAISCAMSGIGVYDSSKVAESLSGQVDLKKLSDIGIDALLPRRAYLAIKSVIDFTVALLLIPIVVLILVVAAIAIKLDSKGPIFFVQDRCGYKGHTFRCYKLRSMYVQADKIGPAYTTSGDARITRVGRFIRKYRIDELPQIFNILKNEMSWIGPRPESWEMAKKYEKHIPFYSFRYCVRPGITGWAAIRQGNVAEISAATEKLENDFFYIKNLSLTLDALIAVKTISVIFTGFGSK